MTDRSDDIFDMGCGLDASAQSFGATGAGNLGESSEMTLAVASWADQEEGAVDRLVLAGDFEGLFKGDEETHS